MTHSHSPPLGGRATWTTPCCADPCTRPSPPRAASSPTTAYTPRFSRAEVLFSHMNRLQAVAAHLEPHSAPAPLRYRPAARAAATTARDEAALRPRAVSPRDITFGCSPIGPRYGAATAATAGHRTANGPGDTRQALVASESAAPAIHAALAAGIRHFDTAPLYGHCSHGPTKVILISVPLLVLYGGWPLHYTGGMKNDFTAYG